MTVRGHLNWLCFNIESGARIGSAIGLVALLSLMGCVPDLPLPPLLPMRAVQPMPSQRQVSHQLLQVRPEAYRVGPGDVLRVRVDGKPKLSREVTVDAAGVFHHPQMGRIRVAGLTLPQIDGSLGEKLAKRSRQRPKLTTTVIQATHQSVNVLGEVRIPGLHPLQPDGTLMDILSRAGGPTRSAGWVVLVMKNGVGADTQATSNGGAVPHSHRNENGAELTLPVRVDLEKLVLGEAGGTLPIGHGDTVFVPEAGDYFVYGDVQNPGQYRLRRDTTVIKAVTRAGGFTQYGSEEGLSIWRHHLHQEPCDGDLCLWGTAKREMNEPPQRFRVRLHDRLQPGDIVVVR